MSQLRPSPCQEVCTASGRVQASIRFQPMIPAGSEMCFALVAGPSGDYLSPVVQVQVHP